MQPMQACERASGRGMDSRTRFFMLHFHASRLGKRMTSMEHLVHKDSRRTPRSVPRGMFARIRGRGRAKEKFLSARERFCGRGPSIGVKGGVWTRCPAPGFRSDGPVIKTSSCHNCEDTNIGNMGNTSTFQPFGRAPKPARSASPSQPRRFSGLPGGMDAEACASRSPIRHAKTNGREKDL